MHLAMPFPQSSAASKVVLATAGKFPVFAIKLPVPSLLPQKKVPCSSQNRELRSNYLE